VTHLPSGSARPLRRSDRPGSAGEHLLQAELGTAARADRYYEDPVRDHLNPQMRDFVRRQEMFFLATSDATGACDNTLRAGPAGFLEVLDGSTLAWPEFKGNGVMASLGNISENPQVGILMVDFVRDTVGLHVNGTARLMEPAAAGQAGLESRVPAGRGVRFWVVVDVEEAYIHCSKHIPRLAELPAEDAPSVRRARTADYFGTATERRTNPQADDAAAAS
jgi:predicted pyridoxine 5'-phosphate oxidase superfamily flavin-nucleotide-binding protein